MKQLRRLQFQNYCMVFPSDQQLVNKIIGKELSIHKNYKRQLWQHVQMIWDVSSVFSNFSWFYKFCVVKYRFHINSIIPRPWYSFLPLYMSTNSNLNAARKIWKEYNSPRKISCKKLDRSAISIYYVIMRIRTKHCG